VYLNARAPTADCGLSMPPKLIDLELDESKLDVTNIQHAQVEITDSLNNRYTFVTFYATAVACLIENYMDEKST
jgi:hypothetical protein